MAEQNGFSNFGRGFTEEHLCEIILNLNQRLKRCCVKSFQFEVMMAVLFDKVELFGQLL